MKTQSQTFSSDKFAALAAKINHTQHSNAFCTPKEVKTLLATTELFKTGMIARMDGEPRFM